MDQDHLDPSVWHGMVQLPFGMADFDRRGLFEFRFGIATAGGLRLFESGKAREHTHMHENFYHAFRSLKKDDPDRPVPLP